MPKDMGYGLRATANGYRLWAGHGPAPARLWNVHLPQSLDGQVQEPADHQDRDPDRKGQAQVARSRESPGVDHVHERDRIVPDAEKAHAFHEPGEEALPQHDVEESDPDRLRGHQPQPDERRGVEGHADD